MGNILTVAIADPLNVFAADDIATVTGCRISVVTASEKEIEEAIIEHYEAGTHEDIIKIIEEMKPRGDIELMDEKAGRNVSF